MGEGTVPVTIKISDILLLTEDKVGSSHPISGDATELLCFGEPGTGMSGRASVPSPKEQGNSIMEFGRKAAWTQKAF